jgi:hypothetical protein
LEVEVPLGRGQWIRNRADEPAVYVKNRFFEDNPTNTENQVALIERPALVFLTEAGVGPCRRLYHEPGFSNDDLFHVSGQQLFKHHMNINRVITTTQIPGLIDGKDDEAPDMAATDQYLWITDGSSLQYTDGTSALVSVPTPDDIPFVSLDVFNGYVLCVQDNSDKFYWIQPGATTVDPLDFASAERFPDKIFQVRVVGDEFWLLGEKSIEVWRATGDGDAPFQRIEGRAFNFGIWSGTAVRCADTSVLCVSDTGTAYNIAGTPSPVSNPAVANVLRDAILSAKEKI